MASAMPAKAVAQNITSAALFEAATRFRACLIAALASRLEIASLTRRRRSCRSDSLCIRTLRSGCRLRLNNLGRPHDNAPRHAHHSSPLGNVAHNQGVGSDLGTAANSYLTR